MSAPKEKNPPAPDANALANGQSAESEPKTARKSAKKEAVAEFKTPELDKDEETLELGEVSEVVCTIGAKKTVIGNEVKEVEPAKTQVFTAEWYLGLYRHKNGKPAQFDLSLDGYPIYDDKGVWVSTGPITDDPSLFKAAVNINGDDEA